ncbi:response regulator [Thioclava atlantica]|uniref:Response regulator receiver domain-containing protein n=1 Tax=Thioclava atlantica TaxID=1317124 RepID=A0A085TSD2_9RHOB|nr:response regulator [Thioclava atlantica]KFE33629.1 response regulator receiver domain-containing protein [Thioclava atlantica]
MNGAVLLAEDEAVVALDLSCMLEDMGVCVLGPCATVAAGLDIVAETVPDIAILDVMLADGEVYELADRLHDARVPILFHSGHADAVHLTSRYPGSAICPKPALPAEIEAHISRLLAQAD